MDQIGEQLRQARTAKGLSLGQVEEATKIRVRYLEALEHGDYDVLPGRVYTVGFLRSYARYLDLDAESLVNRYRKETEARYSQQRHDTLTAGAGIPSRERSQTGRILVVLLLIGILLSGAFLVYRMFAPDQQPPPPGLPSAPSSKEQPRDVTPEKTYPVQVTGPTEQAVLPTEVEIALLVESDKCWIEVEVDGRQDFTGTLYAKDERTYSAEKSIKLILGNTGVVRVIFNGNDLGYLGKPGEVVHVEFTPEGFNTIKVLPRKTER
ncbi:hypothetical protein SY88_00715 [Clostridiales bacterium PH28_bin88]|nr:hypothetical protein SY88_00715 [Clostridiales bacterium PH28_bin88]